MRKNFVIIGLGSFGSTVARQLHRMGHDVVGVDIDEARVAALADQISHTVIADVRDERALEELGVKTADGVVVAIGEHLEANILCTLALKQMGVGCVWAKALTSSQERILERVGADRVINPEFDIGVHVAQMLAYPFIIDYISLGDNFYIVEIEVPKSLEGRPLSDLKLGDRFGIRYLTLKRGAAPLLDDSSVICLQRGDRVVLMGRVDQLRRFGSEVL